MGCTFLATPLRGKEKRQTALPGECKDFCPMHLDKALLHRPCFARLYVHEDNPGYYCVKVMDRHANIHPIPPQTFDKLPTVIKQGITKKIIAHKDLGATALIVGSTKRTS